MLAPPGAGLPKLELLVARLLFAWKSRQGGHAHHAGVFCREHDAILLLARSCTPEQAATRVLIPRLRGMEDSSRFWSVWMTLDHLRITNVGFAGAIRSLRQGVVPGHKASTAAVKPSPGLDESVVGAFEQSCSVFLKASRVEGTSLATLARYPHPWFGPLDAAGWHAIGGFHMALHRRQIESILAGLPRR
ncbi:MAG: DinB family protein [Prosthecobacter sp.]